jgi:hypothetical protein
MEPAMNDRSENPPLVTTDASLSPCPPAAARNHGTWMYETDAQFLIEWRIEPLLESPSTSGLFPPPLHPAFRARVRVFQEVFDTQLLPAQPEIPFSLWTPADSRSPCLQGHFSLDQEGPRLTVRQLRFPGFYKPLVVLFPADPVDLDAALESPRED